MANTTRCASATSTAGGAGSLPMTLPVSGEGVSPLARSFFLGEGTKIANRPPANPPLCALGRSRWPFSSPCRNAVTASAPPRICSRSRTSLWPSKIGRDLGGGTYGPRSLSNKLVGWLSPCDGARSQSRRSRLPLPACGRGRGEGASTHALRKRHEDEFGSAVAEKFHARRTQALAIPSLPVARRIQIRASRTDRAVRRGLRLSRATPRIEVDGGQHADNRRDAVREQWLVAHRYRVLRFWNNEVLGNIEGVWDTIFATASAAAPPHPDPLPASGERESPSRTSK